MTCQHCGAEMTRVPMDENTPGQTDRDPVVATFACSRYLADPEANQDSPCLYVVSIKLSELRG